MSDQGPASPIPIEQFRALLLAELPGLHRLSRHVARNGNDADDLLQETVLRSLRAAATFRLRAAGIRPWLFQILYNTYRNMRRDEPINLTLEHFDQDARSRPEDSSGGQVTALDWQQVDQEIYAAVQQLGDEYRIVFILFAVEELKYREIGEVLGLPLGTVMSRLARARQQLIKLLPPRRSSRPSEEANESPCAKVSVCDV